MIGMNPKMMERMMKQMGIKQSPVPADEVIIKSADKTIRITNPTVFLIEAQGQKTWQVVGNAVEEENKPFSEEDVKLVAEKTGKTAEEAERALQETGGDIAEAILRLG